MLGTGFSVSQDRATPTVHCLFPSSATSCASSGDGRHASVSVPAMGALTAQVLVPVVMLV